MMTWSKSKGSKTWVPHVDAVVLHVFFFISALDRLQQNPAHARLLFQLGGCLEIISCNVWKTNSVWSSRWAAVGGDCGSHIKVGVPQREN